MTTTPPGSPTDRHERLLEMRTERTLVDDESVTAAIEEVDNSGLIPLLQEFVHLPRGRRRTLHLRSLLIGLHLCTQATRRQDRAGTRHRHPVLPHRTADARPARHS
ncbi:hypothetical protein ACRJ4W_40545 [Streptomyces sp. GLT-R25]